MIGRLVLPAAITCAFGCTDLGQLASVEASFSFAVPFSHPRIEGPEPRVTDLLTSDDVRELLEDVGMDDDEIDEIAALVGGDLADLQAVQAVYDLEPVAPALTRRLIEVVEEDLVAEVEAAVDDAGVEGLEAAGVRVDFSRWDGWVLDLEDPDGSFAAALSTFPVELESALRVRSVRGVLEEELDADALELTDRVIALEVLEALEVDEVGIRTLRVDEEEPDGGFSDDEAAAMRRGLLDAEAVDPCAPWQPPWPHALVVDFAIDDPGAGRDVPFLEARFRPGVHRCGVRMAPPEPVDLRDYYHDGLTLVTTAAVRLSGEPLALGGYLRLVATARLSIPGSIDDVAAILE